MSGNYFLIDKRVLPDVYEKVVNAKKLLREGKVKETKITLVSNIALEVGTEFSIREGGRIIGRGKVTKVY